MKTKPLRRRFTDKIRILADEAWTRGNRDLSQDLHDLARKEEKKRRRTT